MSKVSEFHKVYHAEHEKLATSHAVEMSHYPEGSHQHEHHKTKHESHTRLRDYHHKEMNKAVADEMNKVDTVPTALEDVVRATFLKMFGNTLVPTAVSAVAPTAPGIRAVPRGGERPVPVTPNVPLEFAKLVAVDEEQDRLM
jgi:hypothetical protein